MEKMSATHKITIALNLLWPIAALFLAIAFFDTRAAYKQCNADFLDLAKSSGAFDRASPAFQAEAERRLGQ
jgi:hypothetical protein